MASILSVLNDVKTSVLNVTWGSVSWWDCLLNENQE